MKRNESWGHMELRAGRILCWMDGKGVERSLPDLYLYDEKEDRALPLGFLREFPDETITAELMDSLSELDDISLVNDCKAEETFQRESDRYENDPEYQKQLQSFTDFLETL